MTPGLLLTWITGTSPRLSGRGLTLWRSDLTLAWIHGTSPWMMRCKLLAHSDKLILDCHPRTCCEGPSQGETDCYRFSRMRVISHRSVSFVMPVNALLI